MPCRRHTTNQPCLVTSLCSSFNDGNHLASAEAQRDTPPTGEARRGDNSEQMRSLCCYPECEYELIVLGDLPPAPYSCPAGSAAFAQQVQVQSSKFQFLGAAGTEKEHGVLSGDMGRDRLGCAPGREEKAVRIDRRKARVASRDQIRRSKRGRLSHFRLFMGVHEYRAPLGLSITSSASFHPLLMLQHVLEVHVSSQRR